MHYIHVHSAVFRLEEGNSVVELAQNAVYQSIGRMTLPLTTSLAMLTSRSRSEPV